MITSYIYISSIILNYRLNHFKTTNCIFTCSILYYSSQKATISSNYADIYSRTQLNDSSVNLLYFFWTHFFYLPLLFFILLNLIHVFAYSVPKISNVLAVYTVILLTYYAISNYYSLNTAEAVIYNTSSFNLLLSNPTNKYHPLLFYLTSLAILLLFYRIPQTNYLFANNFYTKNNLTLTITITYLLVLTLYLGSWWALQEGSWGGW
jgi:hypothetical protein